MGNPVTWSSFDSQLPDCTCAPYNDATVVYPPLVAFTGLYIVSLSFRTSVRVASPPKRRVHLR